MAAVGAGGSGETLRSFVRLPGAGDGYRAPSPSRLVATDARGLLLRNPHGEAMTKALTIHSSDAPELLSKAQTLLQEARTLDEVLRVRTLAKTAEHYFKAAGHSRTIAKDAAEIRLRAERKAGEILLETRKSGERASGRPSKLLQPATLSELEIERTQAHRWQQIANVPEEVFEEYIEERKDRDLDELTTSGLMTQAKFANKRQAAEEIRKQPPPLPEGPFRVIVADPPWPYAERRPTNDSRGYPGYSGISLEEIQALPVIQLADEDSFLWLWTTNAFLEDSFSVCRAWGFQYRTLLTWGKNRIGLGDWLRGQTEHCLLATRGYPVITVNAQGTLLIADVGEHSAKPEAFYALVEQLCPAPDLGRVELFARKSRPGWRIWGAEANREEDE